MESHEHESIQFDLSKQLKAKVRSMFYDKDATALNVYIMGEQSGPIVSKVDTSSMRATLEQFDKNVDGTLDPEIKSLCVYSIKYHLRKFIKFDDDEQEWYSENYPNDPSLIVDKDEDEEHHRTNAEIAKPAISGKIALLVQDASEDIMNKHSFITIEETDEILYYEKGVYKPGGKILIAKGLEAEYGYQLNTHSLSQIIGHIMRKTYHKNEELDADLNIINLQNGLYNVDKDILLDHTPRYLSINQKPITYNKKAMSKLFGKFLIQVLYRREVRTAIDAMAYTFERDYPIETIFMLYGLGANGKTVYTSLLTAMHGADHISNVPLPAMLGTRDMFALSDLEHKDVNIDNELAGQTIKESAVLKRLTGGSRQRIRIQRKNQKAYDTTLYAKLFFNANAMPDSADTSDAYNRRVLIIVFPNRFEGETEDKQLISKLTTEEEKSGIFNILMAELRRIRATKQLYLNEKTIEERRLKYERAVNPVKAFLEEAVAEDSTTDNVISKTEFHDAYVLYCNKYALPPQKYDYFCKILKNQFKINDTRVDIKGNGKQPRERWWSGIALTEEYAPKTAQQRLRPPWTP